MIKSAKVTWKTAIIPIATVFLIWWLKISPAYVILAAIAGSLIYALIIRRRETTRRETTRRETRDNGPSTGSGTSSRVSESRVPRQKRKEAKP
jgi:hypothetical protein